MRKWFSLFDADRNCRLDLQELSAVLQHAGLRLSARELPRVFRLLDTSGDGRLAYTEFCDVVEGRTVPDYRAFVKAERARQSKLDEKKLAEQAQAANIRSVGADLGSS